MDKTNFSMDCFNFVTGDSDVEYKIDTGAEVNSLPKSVFSKIGNKPKLRLSSVKFSAYNESSIPVYGEGIMPIKHNEKNVHALFIELYGDQTRMNFYQCLKLGGGPKGFDDYVNLLEQYSRELQRIFKKRRCCIFNIFHKLTVSVLLVQLPYISHHFIHHFESPSVDMEGGTLPSV